MSLPVWFRAVAAWVALAIAYPAWAGIVVVDFLDIGQGDAIVIRGGGKTVLIDAGDRGKDTADQLVQLGITKLDLAVASHPHADHIGSMRSVLERFEVGLYIDSGLTHTTATYNELMQAIEERDIPYRRANAGMAIRLGDEAVLHVLFPADPPLRGTRSDLNSNSVVLSLEHGEMDFLFTGDAEAPTEQRLLRMGLGPHEVLKVAHHGSEHSSGARFLEVVEPQIAVICVGEGNRYKHPRPEALERLQHAGALVYRTDTSGHVRILSDGTRVEAFEGTLAELGPRWPLPPLVVPPVAPPTAEEAPPAEEDGKKKRRKKKKRR